LTRPRTLLCMALVLTACLAGCSRGGAVSTSLRGNTSALRRPPSETTTTAVPPPTCTARNVASSVGSDAYLGSGQNIDAVLLSNTSSRACSIHGFPVISFFGEGSASPELVAEYRLAAPFMDIPPAFQRVTASTLTTLKPHRSAALYYSWNGRATSASCVMQYAGLEISWAGAHGDVRFPATPGLFTIQACDWATVAFSQIGPAEPRLFVPRSNSGPP